MMRPNWMWVSDVSVTCLEEGVKGLGSDMGSIAYAIMPWLKETRCRISPPASCQGSLSKGELADATFAAAYSPWTVGYMAGSAAIKVLGKKRIFFWLGR